MTDTPRTDAAAGDGTTVPADFAADLERELNEARAEVERLREVAKQALEAIERNWDGPMYIETANALEALRTILKETK
jgi:phage shock protein A